MAKSNFSADMLMKLFLGAKGNGAAEDFVKNKLSPEQRGKLENLLSDKEAVERLMKSRQAQDLMRKFGDGKNGKHQ